ncbi:MAG: hypothetical protein ACON43_03570 [Flavobacteriaceae bacterium]
MKYEYKMIIKESESLHKEIGAYVGGTFSLKNSDTPVDIPFANELGEQGFECFHVNQVAMDSWFYFRRVKG